MRRITSYKISAEYWNYLENINKDINKSIEQWIDIKYINYNVFKPYGFFKNKENIIAAMKEAYEVE